MMNGTKYNNVCRTDGLRGPHKTTPHMSENARHSRATFSALCHRGACLCRDATSGLSYIRFLNSNKSSQVTAPKLRTVSGIPPFSVTMLNLIYQILFATGLRPSFIIGHTVQRLINKYQTYSQLLQALYKALSLVHLHS